jgi:N-acetyl sugar amidotransferase
VSIKTCHRCILSEADYAEITFDDKGVCSICATYDTIAARELRHGNEGTVAINSMLREITTWGKGKEYDCIIGVSGGVDSTYLVYKAKEWGLRPLIVHVDNGWNTELAVSNIKEIISKLGFDLYTYVIDWEEMRDLQLAFFRASVVDMDLPTDNAYVAAVFKVARERKIKYVLSGHNVVTEGWLPPNFTHFKYDIINMKAIHKQFGTIPLRTFPMLGVLKGWYLFNVAGIKVYSPLNFLEYNKKEVKRLIQTELGWRDYGGKHFENIFTRFYQGYILCKKFGVDKRKSHLSTLICSGQLSRETALEEIEKSPYPSQELFEKDREFFIKKLGITIDEFERLMAQPAKSHLDYPSVMHWYKRLRPFGRVVKKLFGKSGKG